MKHYKVCLLVTITTIALFACIVAMMNAFIAQPAYAETPNTDWNDNEVSEQIAREHAKAQWCEENPCYQPNFSDYSPQGQAEIIAKAKQKEIR